MTHREARSWAHYISRHGSLNISKRIEHSVALLAYTWVRSQGGTAELVDFMPHAPRPEPPMATVQEVFALFQTLKKVPA